MSQLLLTTNNYILFAAARIVYGHYEDEDKWALYDENGNIFLYALDDHYRVVDFAGELPEDIYEYGKYIWDDAQSNIRVNPDWNPEEDESLENQVAALNSTVDALATEVIPGTSEAMQMQIDALSEAIDDLMTNVIPALMEG